MKERSLSIKQRVLCLCVDKIVGTHLKLTCLFIEAENKLPLQIKSVPK